MTVVTPVCAYCKHFEREDRTKEVCKAFPSGIPTAILDGKSKHLTSVEGDKGITFDPLPGFEYVREDVA